MNRSILGMFLLCFATTVMSETTSPYVGQETHSIKSLSATEIEDYLAGKGMGFAKAAELNNYPGPSHVLELAEQLALTTTQRQQTQALFIRMQSQAKELGRELVNKERELNQQFSTQAITAENLERLLQVIAVLRGKLRNVHLSVHLEQTAILSRQQVQHYVKLRGYSGERGANHKGH